MLHAASWPESMIKIKNLMMRHFGLIGILFALLVSGAADFSAQASPARVRQDDEKAAAYLPPGMDPLRDSISRTAFRAKMDSVRKHHPVVALVLMGGGAKGAAHVGVIRYLEELDIPIDMVLGTSMGGLVGGLLAVGYNSSQMDSLMRSIDWNVALTDKIPPSYVSYNDRKYKEKYALSFPFYYSKKDFLKQRAEAENYERKHDDLHLGNESGADASSVVKDNILGSLPSGMVFGQNVNNIFSSVTTGYQDSTQFWKLPVPFACVATEMVTGKAKVWYEGELNTALRSTMSIPGLFTPVRVGGMVLVDGGMRDNYPTKLAKELGADIVIGVNLSSGYRDYKRLKNFGDLLSQFIDMYGREAIEENLKIPDVTVKPDMKGYNMMSFDAESIDTLVRRGYEAAMEQTEQLKEIKEKMKGYGMRFNAPPAVNLATKKVSISGISINGVDDSESLFLQKRISLDPLQKFGSKEIEDAESIIYATGAFDYVTYGLLGRREPYRLVFNSKKGPVNHLGLGARFDSEEIVSAILNLGINVHRINGFRFDFEGKIGTNPFVGLTASYMLSDGMSVNASASWHYTDRNLFTFGSTQFKLNYYNIQESLFLSNLRWSWFDMKIGVRNNYFNVRSMLSDETDGDYDLKDLRSDCFGPFLNMRCDTYDNGYFPTRGVNIGIDYQWLLSPEKGLLEKSFHTIQLDVAAVVRFGNAFHMIPSLRSRYLIGDDIPIAYTNVMGGSMAGRYLDQQMPFIGINYAAGMPNFLTVVRDDFRVRLFKNNYLTAIANYAIAFNEIDDISQPGSQLDSFGAGVQYSYNTVIGPLSMNVHWSDYTHRWGVYVGIGFDF